ncbi:MAG: phosphoribosyltransferase [Bauldia sp.]
MWSGRPEFGDRADAGRRLGQALARFAKAEPLVLALPRGGVPVAFEVARVLHAPLDLLLVRKIGAPGHAELGLGAVVDGDDPQIVLNDPVIAEIGVPDSYIEAETARQLEEIERRRRSYLGDRRPMPAAGRTVIVVDDGIATGGTVRAALQALRRTRAARTVLAVPVAPKDVLAMLRPEADEIVCLATPEPFLAVGLHYRDFAQTSDAEVVRLLERSRSRSTSVH